MMIAMTDEAATVRTPKREADEHCDQAEHARCRGDLLERRSVEDERAHLCASTFITMVSIP
jgi:hypothetical protein